MKKIYIVKYYGDSWGENEVTDIFVTDKKQTAIKYVARFNRILKKWKDHYKKYEEQKYSIVTFTKKKEALKFYNRWNKLRDVSECFYDVIELR
jgi:hypothetical protein